MATKLMSWSSIACVFLVGALLQVVYGFDYDVGGDFGWNVPPIPTFFSDWTHNKTFFVGDKLVFQSNSSEFHDVAEPESQTDFDGCVKPGISLSTSSAMLSVLLDSPRRRYFICTIGNHCNAGMKFTVDVFVNPNSALLPPPPPPPSSASSLRFGAVLAAAMTGLLFLVTI